MWQHGSEASCASVMIGAAASAAAAGGRHGWWALGALTTAGSLHATVASWARAPSTSILPEYSLDNLVPATVSLLTPTIDPGGGGQFSN